MGFFKSIEKHLDNINLNMTITKSETGIVVSVLPVLNCKDDTKKSITPILLKGTAEEMDNEFAGIIQQPLELVSGVASNIIEFEQSVSKAKENSAVKKDTDAKAKKLQDKADKEIEKAQPYIEKKEYGKAILLLKAAVKFAPKYAKAIKMLEETQALDTPDLFKEKEVAPKKREAPKGPNVIINKVPLEEPTSMKEVAIEEQQKAEIVEEAVVVYNKTKADGKPLRADGESMDSIIKRLSIWETEQEEHAQLGEAMHKEEDKSPFKEKPELSGMKPNVDFDDDVVEAPDPEDDADDDFDDIDF